MLPIGSWLSLITKAEVRYVGRLVEIDFQNASLVLEKVIVHGTEGRVSNRDDEVLPLREGHNWRIRFEGADLKEVFLLPQSTSALREHEVGARGDYDKDKKNFSSPHKERPGHLRHSQQESTHIKDISDSEAAVYENQPLGDARKPYRTPAPHKRQDPRRIEDISESAFYKFRPPQEAEIGKYEYDGLVCRGGGESNEHRDKDQNYEYDDNERDRLSNVESVNPIKISEAAMVENLKQLYIGTQNKSSRRAHNRRGPTQDPHSFPPKELATSGNDQVYYPNTRIHTRAQDRGYEAHAPGRTYRGSDENYDNTQSKFKPNVAHAVRQSSSREGKYASSQLDDNTMKNVKKYSYHGRYPYSAAARQSPRDMLQPLDTEEIFGKTSDFATQQRYATSTESTTEKKLFYVKDSFFDNLSCASKDRRPSGVDSNYRNKRHEENNMNMQTFGEILNFSSRHPRFKYSDNYRKNQQNGQRHDYAGNDSSFSHRHNSQNSNREKYRRNKPELPQDQIKAMDSSRVA